jgi:hypothetical protein
MTEPAPGRTPAAQPTRAITYTTDDPNQPADPATDPHAAEKAAEPAEQPARPGKRAGKTAE